MTNGEAAERLKAYLALHGSKLNGPWKRNPVVNVRDWINKLLGGVSGKPADDRCGGVVERAVMKITPTRPPVCKAVPVKLSADGIIALNEGRSVQVVVGNTVLIIERER